MDIAELSMILETIGPKQVSEEELQNAMQKVKNATNLLQEQQLVLYGLYKQYTFGDVNIPEPGIFDLVAKKKWEAWKSFEGFPKTNAALAYVYIVDQLINPTDEISANAFGAGGDSDANDGSQGMDGFGAIISTLNVEYGGSMKWSSSEAIFEAVVENNIEAVRQCIAKGENIHAKNSEGMTPLHFAADRGTVDIASLLLDSGADINALDGSHQTPLMYAVSCEHQDMVVLLVKKGADLSCRNEDGQAVADFEDVSPEILAMLTTTQENTITSMT